MLVASSMDKRGMSSFTSLSGRKRHNERDEHGMSSFTSLSGRKRHNERDERGMSSFTSLSGRKRHNERDKRGMSSFTSLSGRKRHNERDKRGMSSFTSLSGRKRHNERDEHGMSSFTSLSGRKRHNERERFLANAQRRQSMELERTLHVLDVQYHRDLAGVQGAQQDLRRSLDRFGDRSSVKRDALALPPKSSISSSSKQPKRTPNQPCCPNHIVCSSCNLRLRLADALTRRFTPSLWTMYTCPVTTTSSPGEIYYMPRFIQQRNLSISDNSLRYLPFM